MDRSKAEIKADIERNAFCSTGTVFGTGVSDWEDICRLAREYGQLRGQEASVDKDVLALLLMVLQTLHNSAMTSQANTFWNLLVSEVLQVGENHLEFHPLPG